MIGSNIQSGRKTMGLTQEQLAERLGVARQTVAKWEAGDSVPDLANAGALAEALDVSLDALVGFDPQGTMLAHAAAQHSYLFGLFGGLQPKIAEWTAAERAANPDAHLTLAWVPHDWVRGLYFYDDFDVRFAETFHDGSWFAGVDQADLLSRIACPAVYLKAKTNYGEDGLSLAANSDEDAARVQELVGACETIVVESGHDIHYDHPEAFVEAMDRVAGNN